VDSQSQTRLGRPAQFDRDAVERELLGLFWEHGYDHVSQQEMAAATGLSTSSLYNSFGTKSEIFQSVLRRYAEWFIELIAPLETGTTGLDDLARFLDAFDAQLDGPLGQHGCLITNTMTTQSCHDTATRAMTDTMRKRLGAALVAVLSRAAAQGEPVPNPKSTAPLIMAALLGILTTARSGKTVREARVQLRALRALTESWRLRPPT
jgi:TetR/AcrR family transcriptional regulator, transcriptional repressor for nem operon